jgi:hypothetical protein
MYVTKCTIKRIAELGIPAVNYLTVNGLKINPFAGMLERFISGALCKDGLLDLFSQ